PPELVFLAEQECELAAIAVIALPGHVTENAGRTAGGIEQTSQHFEGGGLARAIGAEEADQLARLDGEAYLLDGERLLVLAAEQAFDCAAETRLLFVGAKGFGKAGDFDGRHGPI